MKVHGRKWPTSSRHATRTWPAYILKGEPIDAKLVVRFADGDRVVCADEISGLMISFQETTDEELFILREGGYWIADY